ncbi:hypothetical protein J2R99_000406 [Rhodopseudomonas julia]|uniref:DUF6456 domain-containing protein n=1 Tax=Rhodopseudomonas julia TaxID=200617 RepID=A0ABU0C2X1_9BRAD|nr:DUF6456 domain-containing protein [Rhodopseudomonas julia]MDQ0324557.1 hypothetical protein [Rhodopseudomonas julia]
MSRGRRRGGALESLIEALLAHADARLVEADAATFFCDGTPGRRREVPAALVKKLLAAGLLCEAGERGLVASEEAAAWLRRTKADEPAFLAQHKCLERQKGGSPSAPAPLTDLDESPIGLLARRGGEDGSPYLGAPLVAAAERLRRDFERASLQPRITANWQADLKAPKGSRQRGGQADLTETAIAARARFHAAMEAVGPELAGVLLDVACFLKGLSSVERERGYPARSAKLVLKLALQALARHYGIEETAEGKARVAMRHWGAEGYRPTIGD